MTDDFEKLMLYEERIDNLIDWLLKDGLPTGHSQFDQAWEFVRRDRAQRAPKDCMLTRRLVDTFSKILEEIRAQS